MIWSIRHLSEKTAKQTRLYVEKLPGAYAALLKRVALQPSLEAA
jgi:hypothetical protein